GTEMVGMVTMLGAMLRRQRVHRHAAHRVLHCRRLRMMRVIVGGRLVAARAAGSLPAHAFTSPSLKARRIGQASGLPCPGHDSTNCASPSRTRCNSAM